MVKLKIVSKQQEQIEEAVFDIYNILLEAEAGGVPAPQAQGSQQSQKPKRPKDPVGGVGRFGKLTYDTKLRGIIKIRNNIRKLKASLGNKNIPIYGKTQEWEQIDAILKRVQKKYNDNPSLKLFRTIDETTTKLAQELISPRTAAKPAVEPTPAAEPAAKPAQDQAAKLMSDQRSLALTVRAISFLFRQRRSHFPSDSTASMKLFGIRTELFEFWPETVA